MSFDPDKQYPVAYQIDYQTNLDDRGLDPLFPADHRHSLSGRIKTETLGQSGGRVEIHLTIPEALPSCDLSAILCDLTVSNDGPGFSVTRTVTDPDTGKEITQGELARMLPYLYNLLDDLKPILRYAYGEMTSGLGTQGFVRGYLTPSLYRYPETKAIILGMVPWIGPVNMTSLLEDSDFMKGLIDDVKFTNQDNPVTRMLSAMARAQQLICPTESAKDRLHLILSKWASEPAIRARPPKHALPPKKCARSGCNEPSVQPHRRGAGLCREHAKERKRRQDETANQSKCHCGNVSGRGQFYCSACHPMTLES